jgi:malonyl-ACP decarboxylase
VEAIATLIQLREGFLHPSLNLKEAITDRIDWVKGNFRQFSTEYAMSNSFGFGGLNSSIIFKYNSH